jgi:hypothetical protein
MRTSVESPEVWSFVGLIDLFLRGNVAMYVFFFAIEDSHISRAELEWRFL